MARRTSLAATNFYRRHAVRGFCLRGSWLCETPARLRAIEKLIRSRPVLAVKLASAFNLESELRNVVLAGFDLSRFHTARVNRGGSAWSRPRPMYPSLPTTRPWSSLPQWAKTSYGSCSAYSRLQAPIDWNYRAGQVGSIIRSKEHCDFCRFPSCTHAAHRDLCISLLA